MPAYEKGMYLKGYLKNGDEKSFQIIEIKKDLYTLGYKIGGKWKETQIPEDTIKRDFRPAGSKIVITKNYIYNPKYLEKTTGEKPYQEVGQTPYKVGQKIQNEQGYIYEIVSAYDKIERHEDKGNGKEIETRYLRFKINDGLFNKKMTPEQLIEGRYLFSVLPSEMVIDELYKYDDNDNMYLRERKTIEEVETEENKKILDKYNEKLEELNAAKLKLNDESNELETKEGRNKLYHMKSDLDYKINRLKIKDEVYYLKFQKNSNSEYTEEIVDNSIYASKKFYQYPSNSYLADPNYHVDDNFVGIEGGNKTRRKKNKKQKPRKTKNNKSKKRKIARQ